MSKLTMDQRMERIEDHLVQLIKHVADVRGSTTRLEKRLDEVELNLSNRMTNVEVRLDETNARLDRTNARLEETNARLDRTNARLDETNAHVLKSTTRIEAKFVQFVELTAAEVSRTRYRIEIEAGERKADLALLKKELTDTPAE